MGSLGDFSIVEPAMNCCKSTSFSYKLSCRVRQT